MSDDITEIIKELQKTYLASLPGKITALRELWQKGETKLLKTDYHKLKGTGRTYGLPEVTLIGEVLERICLLENRDLLNEAVPLSLELLHEIGVERRAGRTPHLEGHPKFERVLALAGPVLR